MTAQWTFDRRDFGEVGLVVLVTVVTVVVEVRKVEGRAFVECVRVFVDCEREDPPLVLLV